MLRRVLLLAVVSLAQAILPTVGHAQHVLRVSPDTDAVRVVRPWFSLTIGGGTGTRICPGCGSRAADISPRQVSGPAGMLSTGLTLTPRLGVGATLAGWRYCDSFDCIYGRTSTFYLATVRYALGRPGGLALRGSVGEAQTGEEGFGGGEAVGPAVGLGLTAHLPPRSPLSLTFSLDYMESLAGKYRSVPRYDPLSGSYRTRLFSIGVGVAGWFAP
jgi:hypothetical protein